MDKKDAEYYINILQQNISSHLTIYNYCYSEYNLIKTIGIFGLRKLKEEKRIKVLRKYADVVLYSFIR